VRFRFLQLIFVLKVLRLRGHVSIVGRDYVYTWS